MSDIISPDVLTTLLLAFGLAAFIAVGIDTSRRSDAPVLLIDGVKGALEKPRIHATP